MVIFKLKDPGHEGPMEIATRQEEVTLVDFLPLPACPNQAALWLSALSCNSK